MRFLWAVVAFILAAVMIGAGIAQRTIFEGPSAQSASVTTSSEARYTLIGGDVMTALPGAQSLTIAGDGAVFAAYGRTADVAAWLADTTYNRVAFADDGVLQTEVVTPTSTTEQTSEPTSGEETDSSGDRSPVGSDLWLDEFQQQGELSTPLQLPATMSVLVASDGTAPAPSTITLSWPVDTSTPWAGPLIIGGSVLLVIGLVLYLLGFRHARRSRGPRRKGLPVPITEPIDLAAEGADKGVVSASPRRRLLTRGKRGFVAIPLVAASALVFAGCSNGWAPVEPSGSPSPSASVIVPEGQQAPAVTEAQAQRIITRVSTTVAEADQAMDPALAATRLSGAALAERETNYTLRGRLADAQPLAVIPDSPIRIVLPQAFDGWPRSFLAVVEGGADAAAAPTIMVLTQSTPWSEYTASYIAALEASTNLPELAAPYVGAVLAPPESPFLLLAPTQIAAAYSDIIDKGESSAHWAEFDTGDDQLFAGIRDDRQRRLDELNQTGSGTSSLTFASTAGTEAPLALTTQDGGAIVAVDLYETDTATATAEGAVIKLENSPVVRALTGIDQSARGFNTTYIDQAFFYVPLKDTGEKIRLLGYRSNILEAKEIP